MNVVSKVKKRVKPIIKAWKDVLCKESEEGVLLNVLEKLITKISGQNTDNMNKYTENMVSYKNVIITTTILSNQTIILTITINITKINFNNIVNNITIIFTTAYYN